MCPYETGKEREEGVEKPAALPGPREAPVFGQDLGTVACGRPFTYHVFAVVQSLVPFITFFLLEASRGEASRFLTDPLVNSNRLSVCLAGDCRGTKTEVRLLQVSWYPTLSFKGRMSHTSE